MRLFAETHFFIMLLGMLTSETGVGRDYFFSLTIR